MPYVRITADHNFIKPPISFPPFEEASVLFQVHCQLKPAAHFFPRFVLKASKQTTRTRAM